MKNTDKLKTALRELKNRGESGELTSALASLLAVSEKPTKGDDSKRLARRFLAHAASLLKKSPLPTSRLAGEAHDYIGAALELNRSESTASISPEILTKITAQEAPVSAFLPEPAKDLCESSSFEDAEEAQITAFANVLMNGGYIEEARRYLCAYRNALGSSGIVEGDEEDMKTVKEALTAQRNSLRKKGDLARAKILNEIIADLDGGEGSEEILNEQPAPATSKADVALKECDAIADEQLKDEALKASYMMKAAEQMSLDPNADQAKAASMLKAAEEAYQACKSAWDMKAIDQPAAPAPVAEDGKEMLEVEPASPEEEAAKMEASAAFSKGDIKTARAKLSLASRLEKKRLVAALLKKGDIELAMEGLQALAEEEGDAVAPEVEPEEDQNAGYISEDATDVSEDNGDEDADAGESLDDEAQNGLDVDAPAEDDSEEELDEKQVSEALYHEVIKFVQNGKPKAAARKVDELEKLEASCRKALRTAKARKNKALVKEGRAVVAAVHKNAVLAQAAACGLDEAELTQKMLRAAKIAAKKGNLTEARGLVKEISIIANAIQTATTAAASSGKTKVASEGRALLKKVQATASIGLELVKAEDEEVMDQGAEGAEDMEDTGDENPVLEEEAGAGADEEALDDSLDQAPSEDEDASETAEGGEDEEAVEQPQPEEDNAMHYEALSSVEKLQKMKVSRDALAFTYWDANGAENPFWVIQAAGSPVGTVHLQDQDEPEEIRAFFCDQVKWPNAIAQSVEKVGLYDMLKGVKARFYANEIEKSALASKMKDEAVASLSSTRTEKLGTLKSDFLEATSVAADALNKGLIAGKPNALKKAFCDRLMALGLHNPALIVEDAFAEAFAPFMKQVMADAGEYLQMPKEAFEHTKKIIASSINVSHNQVTAMAHETMSERLARTSMPLTHIPAASEAPSVTAAFEQASLYERQSDLKNRLKLSKR